MYLLIDQLDWGAVGCGARGVVCVEDKDDDKQGRGKRIGTGLMGTYSGGM